MSNGLRVTRRARAVVGGGNDEMGVEGHLALQVGASQLKMEFYTTMERTGQRTERTAPRSRALIASSCPHHSAHRALQGASNCARR